MTYQFRKKQVGQEVVKKITLKLNMCRYAQSSYQTIRNASVMATENSSYTGVIAVGIIDSGLIALWGATTAYMKFTASTATEIVKVVLDGSGVWTVTERGILGTTAQPLTGAFKLYHLGELDGSCYGYSQTCSNADSYVADLFKSVVFSTSSLASGQIYHAGLDFKSVNYTSPELKVGESIGSRGKLAFSINDQVHDDYDLVPYMQNRASAGTLFGKLLARNPYFSGRDVIYSEGLRDAGGYGEPDWIHRTFKIDKVNLNNGKFTCSALDPLILTEGKKAMMPMVSTAQLAVAINSGSTSVVFGNAVAANFGSSGNVIVRIDSELIEVTANGTITMPIVTRGFGHSEIKDHDINATVQNCIRFIDEHIIDAITYALTTWTDTPAAFIDTYATTIALIPTNKISDYVLHTPISVVDFINRLIFIGNLIFYFDDITQKIVIKYTNELDISPIYLTENDHIRKSDKQIKIEEQYTRFNMTWAPFNLAKDTDSKNFQISLTGINIDAESPLMLDEVNEKKAMLYPMLTSSGADYLLGAAAIDRVVSAGKTIPEVFECELDAESIGEIQSSSLELGSIVSIQSQENQNGAGVSVASLYQVVNISGDAFESFKVKFRKYLLYEPSTFDYSITAGTYINYNLHDHFAPATAGTYIVYVQTGAIFGSTNIAVAAFRTGTQAAGVVIKFVARWQLYGMGGNGGNAGAVDEFSATDGQAGGVAFEAGCDCIIDNGSGLIWSGGKGGDGSVSQHGAPFGGSWIYYTAYGGSGGQGYGTSIGGYSVFQQEVAVGDPPILSTVREASGNQSSAGQTGNYGGSWGEGGIAINKNGYNVTITSGNNSQSIRGSIV